MPTLTRADIPPRENLGRDAPFSLRSDSGDGLTLDGWAAVFGRETVISSENEGRFRERIAPGSMKRSFRETPPRVQFDHGKHPLIGSIPIATLESVREDVDPTYAPQGGAHVVARLLDNWLIEPVRDAIAAGAIDGMSFRFTVKDERWYDAQGQEVRDEPRLRALLRESRYDDVPTEHLPVRELRQVHVHELGPVVWPAYADTSVGVRSKPFVVDLGRLADPETRKTLGRIIFAADHSQPTTSPAGEREQPDAQPTTTAAGEHTSMSRNRIRAELARINTLIDIAEGARLERGV